MPLRQTNIMEAIASKATTAIPSTNSQLRHTLPRHNVSIYKYNVQALRGYLTLFSQCTNAREVGETVALIAQKEPGLTSEEIVKERFIAAPHLTKGMSTDNLRIHIDAAWRKRCRMMKSPR